MEKSNASRRHKVIDASVLPAPLQSALEPELPQVLGEVLGLEQESGCLSADQS
jgi:hypothetical protein